MYPDYYYDSIYEIPYPKLTEKGIKGLVFDIDNTLAAHSDKRPPIKVVALVKRLLNSGFRVSLVSNNSAKRVRIFNESFDNALPTAHFAIKPFSRGLKRVMAEMGCVPNETAVIGDQLFTDIWGGNRIGAITILVKPLTLQDVLTVRIKRGLERKVLAKYISEMKHKL
jgi:hypothetical protein